MLLELIADVPPDALDSARAAAPPRPAPGAYFDSARAGTQRLIHGARPEPQATSAPQGDGDAYIELSEGLAAGHGRGAGRR